MKHALFLILMVVGFGLVFGTGSSAQTSSVAGEWAASMSTPGGARPFGIVLMVDGEKLSGTV